MLIEYLFSPLCTEYVSFHISTTKIPELKVELTCWPEKKEDETPQL